MSKAAQLSPETWFADHTYLGLQETWKDEISDQCLRQGAVPIFDFDPSLSGWVLHSILLAGGRFLKKEIASRFEKLEKHTAEERRMESHFVARLKSDGIEARRQVPCGAGIIDVLTDDTIYEIKCRLSRGRIFEAVGQVLIYRAALRTNLRAVIVGRFAPETESLIPFVGGLGIEVMKWEA